MFSDGGYASQETDAHTDSQRYRDQEMEHLIYRQEIQETTEYQESFHDIIQCVIIQRIDQSQRNGGSISPMSMPSSTKGARTKKSVAPIYFMILISSDRTEIPIATVLLIRKMLTASRITIIPMDT